MVDRSNMKKRMIKIISIGVVILLLAVFIWWQNNVITISEYEIELKDKGNGQSILTIVQLSDLHSKEFGKDNEKLITMVEELAPDLIAITGDFLDSSRVKTEVALNLSEKLVEIAPVYYITGNHERLINDAVYMEFETKLKETGVNVLFNRVIPWNEEVDIIGLDDMSLHSGDNTLPAIMEQVEQDKVTILLAHEPQEIEWYAECGADVVLSGHAHGGQVRIPFTEIGLVAPDQGLLPKYTSGVHQCDNTQMVISRGLGNSIIPVRVFNQPEVIKVEVRY